MIKLIKKNNYLVPATKADEDALENLAFNSELFAEPVTDKRSLQQNKYHWSVLLENFARQAELEGRYFSANIWNHHLKVAYLPEVEPPGITKKGYVKWEDSPWGLMLKASTSDLTVRGMAEYLTQCFAYGSQELGVRFPA